MDARVGLAEFDANAQFCFVGYVEFDCLSSDVIHCDQIETANASDLLSCTAALVALVTEAATATASTPAVANFLTAVSESANIVDYQLTGLDSLILESANAQDSSESGILSTRGQSPMNTWEIPHTDRTLEH